MHMTMTRSSIAVFSLAVIALIATPLLFAYAVVGNTAEGEVTATSVGGPLQAERAAFLEKLTAARTQCRSLVGPDVAKPVDGAAVSTCVEQYGTIAQEYSTAVRAYVATLKEKHAEQVAARRAEHEQKIASMKEEIEARRAARFTKWCERFTASTTVPAGFGAAYAVAGDRAKLIALRCDDLSGDVAVDVGDGKETTLVYEKGYVYDGAAKRWKEVELNSDKQKTGPWYTGAAFADLDLADAPGTPDANAWVLAYTCSRASGSWKCGCKDEQCTNPGWQIQQVKRPAAK